MSAAPNPTSEKKERKVKTTKLMIPKTPNDSWDKSLARVIMPKVSMSFKISRLKVRVKTARIALDFNESSTSLI